MQLGGLTLEPKAVEVMSKEELRAYWITRERAPFALPFSFYSPCQSAPVQWCTSRACPALPLPTLCRPAPPVRPCLHAPPAPNCRPPACLPACPPACRCRCRCLPAGDICLNEVLLLRLAPGAPLTLFYSDGALHDARNDVIRSIPHTLKSGGLA